LSAVIEKSTEVAKAPFQAAGWLGEKTIKTLVLGAGMGIQLVRNQVRGPEAYADDLPTGIEGGKVIRLKAYQTGE
jgi:hypothetical protein